jgi:hypothetical protein
MKRKRPDMGGDGVFIEGAGYLTPETADVLGRNFNWEELTLEELEVLGMAQSEARNQLPDWLDLN